MQLIIDKPNPKQEIFFRAKNKYIAYGGARGGGKSWAMRTKCVLLALNYDGIQILLLRRTLGELRENHLMPMRKMLEGIAKYRTAEKDFRFPNGSRIKLGYCDTESDVLQYQGQAYEVIGLEEATHFTEKQFTALTESNRISGNMNKEFSPRMYFTCNPGGVGHDWVKRLFVDRNYRENEEEKDYIFIKSLVYDNHFLMNNNPEYVQTLERLPEKRKRAMLYGDWDAFEGQFFEEFRNNSDGYLTRLNTHVIEPFDVPYPWIIYRSFDWGYSRPFSCGWWAIDFNGIAYRILELYGCCPNSSNEGVKWTSHKVFQEIKRIENEHKWLKGKMIRGIADPSIWQVNGGEAIIEAADKNGVHFEKADNSRIPGWQQVRNRLAFDENGIPMLYVFNNCKAFIRTFPTLVYDTNKVEDLNTDGEDHIADECLIGTTLIHTDKGTKHIQDLVNTNGKVLSSDNKYHAYHDCRRTKKQADVYTITLEDGTTITGTANHPLLTTSGEWVCLSDAVGKDIKVI